MEASYSRQPPYPPSASLFPGGEVQPVSTHRLVKIPGDCYVHPTDVPSYVVNNLDVSRLSCIFGFLWFAGRRGHIRPLHRQRMCLRNIIVTEQADLHLIWYDRQIYIKPLPPFLLCYDFFTRHICASPHHADACGFLQTYKKLIQSPSDHRIAVELGLLPDSISWAQWSVFTAQIRPVVVSERYQYGELRLFRLNLIHRVKLGQWIQGYHLLHTNFNSFFGANFAWPLVTFAYMATVLNAMQVTLASGKQDETVDKVFFGAGITVITAIVMTFCAVAIFFFALLLHNLAKALRARRHMKEEDLERQEKGQ